MSWRVRLLFFFVFGTIAAVTVLMSLGYIEPADGEGPPPPPWVGLPVAAMLAMGAIGPVLAGVWEVIGPRLERRPVGQALMALGQFFFVLFILGGLATGAHWGVREGLEGIAYYGLRGAGIGSVITLVVAGAVALLIDVVILLLVGWSLRAAFRWVRRSHREDSRRRHG